MTKMNSMRILIHTLAAGLLLTLFSCDFGDDEKREFTFTPDVILMKKEQNGTIHYALAYYVYSNQKIESAHVQTPEGETIPLTALGTPLITYARVPDDNDFSPDVSFGPYTFIATNSDGTEKTEQDILSDNSLTIPEITDITYHPNNLSLEVTWTPTAGAENYFVKIVNAGDKKTTYTGYQVDPDSTSYTVNRNDQGWESAPVSGISYILQLNAILYEENSNLKERYYHVNAISIDEETFIWGQ